jgi:hypothetical protein
MSKALAATAKHLPAIRVRPLMWLACGLALMLGGALVYQFEPRQDERQAAEAAQRAAAEAASMRALQRAREREAQARAEHERQAAEEAAERRRRSELEADAAVEAAARRQREELAQKRLEAEMARKAATDSEDAWKRFYRPSERCADSANSATVECVNEYVKARRDFQTRMATRSN